MPFKLYKNQPGLFLFILSSFLDFYYRFTTHRTCSLFIKSICSFLIIPYLLFSLDNLLTSIFVYTLESVLINVIPLQLPVSILSPFLNIIITTFSVHCSGVNPSLQHLLSKFSIVLENGSFPHLLFCIIPLGFYPYWQLCYF